LGTFVFFARWYRAHSLKMDKESWRKQLLRDHRKHYLRSVGFLVLFALFSSVLAWDWIMSIDVHWFSALCTAGTSSRACGSAP
jgi:hypothetical protein